MKRRPKYYSKIGVRYLLPLILIGLVSCSTQNRGIEWEKAKKRYTDNKENLERLNFWLIHNTLEETKDKQHLININSLPEEQKAIIKTLNFKSITFYDFFCDFGDTRGSRRLRYFFDEISAPVDTVKFYFLFTTCDTLGIGNAEFENIDRFWYLVKDSNDLHR